MSGHSSVGRVQASQAWCRGFESRCPLHFLLGNSWIIMKSEFADLHLHTKYSDGLSSPEEVVERSKKIGLKAIAITDHDSIMGIESGLKAGEKNGIEVIPSVELTATEGNEDIHILGYFIDWRDKNLEKKILKIKKLREERMLRMIKKLKDLGVYIDVDRFMAFSGDGCVGRLHLARFLKNEGWVSSLFEAFDRFIGNGKPAYIEIDALSFKEAIDIILKAKGIPVFAHPGLQRRDHLIPEMMRFGLKGLEIYHPSHTSEDIKHYLNIAEKYDLVITGGSDCHGNYNSDILIGKTKLPMSYVERLKELAVKIK